MNIESNNPSQNACLDVMSRTSKPSIGEAAIEAKDSSNPTSSPDSPRHSHMSSDITAPPLLPLPPQLSPRSITTSTLTTSSSRMPQSGDTAVTMQSSRHCHSSHIRKHPTLPPNAERTHGRRRLEQIDITDYFNLPINDAARELGTCATTLKRFCRQRGIDRWPYRKFNYLSKLIQEVESMLDEAIKAEHKEHIERYSLDLSFLKKKLDQLKKNPNDSVVVTRRILTDISKRRGTNALNPLEEETDSSTIPLSGVSDARSSDCFSGFETSTTDISSEAAFSSGPKMIVHSTLQVIPLEQLPPPPASASERLDSEGRDIRGQHRCTGSGNEGFQYRPSSMMVLSDPYQVHVQMRQQQQQQFTSSSLRTSSSEISLPVPSVPISPSLPYSLSSSSYPTAQSNDNASGTNAMSHQPFPVNQQNPSQRLVYPPGPFSQHSTPSQMQQSSPPLTGKSALGETAMTIPYLFGLPDNMTFSHVCAPSPPLSKYLSRPDFGGQDASLPSFESVLDTVRVMSRGRKIGADRAEVPDDIDNLLREAHSILPSGMFGGFVGRSEPSVPCGMSTGMSADSFSQRVLATRNSGTTMEGGAGVGGHSAQFLSEEMSPGNSGRI